MIQANSNFSYAIMVSLIVTLWCPGYLQNVYSEQTDSKQIITDAELDNLENNLKSDPMYRWKLFSGDRKKTVSLLLAAQKRKPKNSIWYSLIEMCFASDQGEARRLPAEERRVRYGRALGYLQESLQALQTAKIVDVDKKDLVVLFESLKMNIAIASVEVGELDSARQLAKERLKNNIDSNSWNYGNVIHKANTILGRVALRKNDLKTAKEHLLKSANTTGSPQLNSFGPSFVLARELLEKKEKAVVLEYLDLVAKFWANQNSGLPSARSAHEHAKQLLKWKNEIISNKIPQDNQWR